MGLPRLSPEVSSMPMSSHRSATCRIRPARTPYARAAAAASALLALFLVACGRAPTTGPGEPPIRPAIIARVVVVGAVPTRVTVGDSVTVTVRAETEAGVPIPEARVTDATSATTAGSPVITASGGSVAIRGVAVGTDSISIRVTTPSMSTATLTVPLIIRPPAGTVFLLSGATAVDVDSSETRSVTLTASLNGTPVPLLPRGVGLALADTMVVSFSPGATAGTFDLGGRRSGTVVTTRRLAGDSGGRVTARVGAVWPWLSVAWWYHIPAGASLFNATFLGIGARDSVLYAGPARGTARPTPVVGVPKFIAVSSSAQTVCALTVDRQAWCGGGNIGGEVGRVAAPFGTDAPWGPVDGPERFAIVTVGTSTVYALTADGRLFGWGATPNGLRDASTPWCGQGNLGKCTPVAVQPGRRFDKIAAGVAMCAREVGTGTWMCGGFRMRLPPGTNSSSILPYDSVTVVSLGRFGPVSYVSGSQNGWSAVASDGRALNWEPFVYNQTSGLPITADTLVIRPEIQWLQAPVSGFGIRADGVLLGVQRSQQLVGTPVVLSTRPVTPSPSNALNADVCVTFVGARDAVCVDRNPALPRPALYLIGRPARP